MENQLQGQPETAWLQQLNAAIVAQLETGKRFTLETLASAMFLSKRQLQRKILAIKGFQANEYVRHVKLEEARRLLLQKKYTTIAEVSAACGFSDAHYFSKRYAEKYGEKPVAVR
jgi:transcriptional regulator GlxA family with amidase domain